MNQADQLLRHLLNNVNQTQTRRKIRKPLKGVTMTSNNSNYIYNFSPDPKMKKIQQGRKWFNEAQQRCRIHFPKLDQDKRKQISSCLKDLIQFELTPLIIEFNPTAMEDADLQLRWKVFEGAYEESLHHIRSHVALKLNIEPSLHLS